MKQMKNRDRVLEQLAGHQVDRPTCYSGMGNATTAGLEKLGLRFAEVHRDPAKMAALAASSVELFGYDAAVAPFDLCVEAEALGCLMNTYESLDALLYPTIKEKTIKSNEEISQFKVPADLRQRGRIPIIREALRQLRAGVGQQAAVGTYLLGPFTLAGQLMELDQLFMLSLGEPNLIQGLLRKLTPVIVELAEDFLQAGADFVTIREMGAASDILSPRAFQNLVQPLLQEVAAQISGPKILHICGQTDKIIEMMADCGYDALSVEQKNNVSATRSKLGSSPQIFGNLDAFNLLVKGSVTQVREAVQAALDAGVDSIWPGCDIWPEAKLENLQAMVETNLSEGASRWHRNKQPSIAASGG